MPFPARWSRYVAHLHPGWFHGKRLFVQTTDRTVLVTLHENVLGGASRSVLEVVPLLEETGGGSSLGFPPSLSEELRARGYEVHGRTWPVSFSVTSLRSPLGALRRLAALAGYLRALYAFPNERVGAPTLAIGSLAPGGRGPRWRWLGWQPGGAEPAPTSQPTRKDSKRS